MKKLYFAPLLFTLLSCKSAQVTSVAPGTLVLDKGASKLSAVAMKNESVPVTLAFPKLEGSLQLNPFKATLQVAIDTLETGDKTRDFNIKEFFFEVAKSASNKSASFEMTQLEGHLETLEEGKSFPMKGKGELELHGVKLKLEGPLAITKLKKGSYSASFKDLWQINIKDAGMMDALDSLNKNCPQPHRVGLNVKLQGELVFVKP